MASIKIDGILRGALRVGASDIHIGSDRSPYFRIEGKARPGKLYARSIS